MLTPRVISADIRAEVHELRNAMHYRARTFIAGLTTAFLCTVCLKHAPAAEPAHPKLVTQIGHTYSEAWRRWDRGQETHVELRQFQLAREAGLYVTCVEGTACLWDVASKRLVSRFPAVSAHLIKNGTAVLADDWQAGETIERKLADPTRAGLRFPGVLQAISFDQKFIVTKTESHSEDGKGTIYVHDLADGTQRLATPGTGAQFLPRSHVLVVDRKEFAIFLTNVSTGKILGEVKGRYLGLALENRVVTTLNGTGTAFYDKNGGQLFPGPARAVSPDFKFLVTPAGGEKLRVTDTSTGRVQELPPGRVPYLELEQKDLFSPDGNFFVFTAKDENGIYTRGLLSAKDTTVAVRISAAPRFFSDDGGLLAGVINEENRGKFTGVWELPSGKELFRGDGLPHQFSSDGRDFLTYEFADEGTFVSQYDIATGRIKSTYLANTDYPSPIHTRLDDRISFLGDSSSVLAIAPDLTIHIHRQSTGEELTHLGGSTATSNSIELSPDGRWLAKGGKHAGIWDLASGKLISLQGNDDDISRLRFSRDGRRLFTTQTADPSQAEDDAGLPLCVWETSSGQLVQTYREGVNFENVSDSGQFVIARKVEPAPAALVANDTLIDTTKGTIGPTIASTVYEWWWPKYKFSPDERFLVQKTAEDGIALGTALLNTQNGQVIQKFAHRDDSPIGGEIGQVFGEERVMSTVDISPSGQHLLCLAEHLEFSGGVANPTTALWSGRLFDLPTGKRLKQFNFFWGSEDGTFLDEPAPQFSANGRYLVFARCDQHTTQVLDTSTQAVRTVPGDFVGMCPQGRFLLTITRDGAVMADLQNNKILFSSPSLAKRLTLSSTSVHGDTTHRLEAVQFSNDGRRFIARGTGDTSLFETMTGKMLRDFSGDADTLFSAVKVSSYRLKTGAIVPPTIVFSPGNNFIVSVVVDGSLRLWDFDGEELCRLVSFADGSWVVATPDGRFDTNSLEEITEAHWIAPDEPIRPLPIEIFMRDYYEPNLLPRLLSGEKFLAVRNITDINRVQPVVTIESVTPQQPAGTHVTATVSVVAQSRVVAGQSVNSGMKDLHLFRNGQLVGIESLAEYTDQATVTFRNLQLPRDGSESVEFTAYAFNVDGVKSDTTKPIVQPVRLPQRLGNAVVVAIGIDDFETHSPVSFGNLNFAARDAKGYSETLIESLESSEQFDEVVSITLTSETASPGHISSNATKRHIKAVFDLLSGYEVDKTIRSEIHNAERLTKVRPEDTVFIMFSTHGFTRMAGTIGAELGGRAGEFYLVPSDIGRQQQEKVLDRCISAEQLSVWLRNIDAGEMVMIIDACQSGGSTGPNFKPGPMGSRGLGQLAYNKRMRILAASQVTQPASESGLIGHGLLSFALLDGLDSFTADIAPSDDRVTLSEWLKHGEQHVPEIATAIKNGTFRSASHRNAVPLGGKKTAPKVQRPVLFDFSKGRDGPVIRSRRTR